MDLAQMDDTTGSIDGLELVAGGTGNFEGKDFAAWVALSVDTVR
jgi:hypothetical protein